jgi:sigma-B regulation protein RsbU (phosphoserine phosphatase)
LSTTEARLASHRALIGKVERLVQAVGRTDDLDTTVSRLVAAVARELGRELGLPGARLYKRLGEDYVLLGTFGEAKSLPAGLRVKGSYPPVGIVRNEGTLYMACDDTRLDRELEAMLGAENFAALELGEEQYLVAFDVPGGDREDILFSLGLLRHAFNQKIRQERVEDVLRQARRIQASILPRQAPKHGPFDMAGRTESMEAVGGDFYDFITITDKILGLAIADVSGHGLPAALQVRDIYMGLRMGMARDFKIVRTVERLNNIIHLSTLTSRFVSVFYGELELNGVFIYVNAGHPPPFHVDGGGNVTYLSEGGVVLGPVPGATYERGFVTLRPGDMLVLYTDGIVETTCDPSGFNEEYGLERLVRVAKARQGEPASQVVEAIFADVHAFCSEKTMGDDRTVVVVTYPGPCRRAVESPSRDTTSSE